MYESSWNGVFGSYFRIFSPFLDPEIWASEKFLYVVIAFIDVAYLLASVPLLHFFATISSQFVETSIKYLLKIMERCFWNIFLIFSTISRTRDMSLRNFFECCRCLHGRGLSACFSAVTLFFAIISSQFVKTSIKNVLKFMEWHFWTIF